MWKNNLRLIPNLIPDFHIKSLYSTLIKGAELQARVRLAKSTPSLEQGICQEKVLWGAPQDIILQKQALVREDLTEHHQNCTGKTGAEPCPAHPTAAYSPEQVILAIVRRTLALEVSLHFAG